MAATKSNDNQDPHAHVDAPDVPEFFIEHNDIKLKCIPVRLITTNTNKELIEYQCLRHPVVPYSQSAQTREVTSGTDETDRLLEDAKEKRTEGESYMVKVPRYAAKIPFEAKRIAEQQLKDGWYFGKYLDMVLPGKMYLSLRPQFAQDHDGSGVTFHTGGSRAGFFYYYKFENKMELIFQYEGNVDFSGNTKFINVSDGDNSNRRLSYIGLRYDQNQIIVGKYWSPYYDIAGLTDNFMAFGGQAGGAFNNGSDGGSSGTGRADEVIQLRTDHGKFETALQVQLNHTDEKTVTKDYQYCMAGSIIFKNWEGFDIGASFAHQKFDTLTPAMEAINIHGDDQSYIIGGTYRKEEFSISSVLSYTKNHMTDDQGTYFNGMGTELYMRYDIDDSYRLAAGGNILIPRDASYEGNYKIKSYILSAQYTFGEKTFDDMVYVELFRSFGSWADGGDINTRIAVGIRYLLQR